MKTEQISEFIQNLQIVEVPGVSDFAPLHSQRQCHRETAPDPMSVHLFT